MRRGFNLYYTSSITSTSLSITNKRMFALGKPVHQNERWLDAIQAQSPFLILTEQGSVHTWCPGTTPEYGTRWTPFCQVPTLENSGTVPVTEY